MATGVLKGMVVSWFRPAASWAVMTRGSSRPSGVRANKARCGETAVPAAGAVTGDAGWAARACCGSFTRMSTTAPLCTTICAVAEGTRSHVHFRWDGGPGAWIQIAGGFGAGAERVGSDRDIRDDERAIRGGDRPAAGGSAGTVDDDYSGDGRAVVSEQGSGDGPSAGSHDGADGGRRGGTGVTLRRFSARDGGRIARDRGSIPRDRGSSRRLLLRNYDGSGGNKTRPWTRRVERALRVARHR